MKFSVTITGGLLMALAINACSSGTGQEERNEDTKTRQVVSPAVEHLDEREVLPFNQMQRAHVLKEMRNLLTASQGIVEGLAKEDMKAVAEAAAAVGMQAMHTVEKKENMKRLKMRQSAPPEFMKLGMGVHKAMDEIAQMAKDGKPAKDIQLKLAETMNACIACHNAYQIPNPVPKP